MQNPPSSRNTQNYVVRLKKLRPSVGVNFKQHNISLPSGECAQKRWFSCQMVVNVSRLSLLLERTQLSRVEPPFPFYPVLSNMEAK